MGDSSQFERVYRHAGRLAEGVDEALVGGLNRIGGGSRG